MIKEDLLKEIEKLKERLKEAYVYYEVVTEKPKRKRFYKNYISRRKNEQRGNNEQRGQL